MLFSFICLTILSIPASAQVATLFQPANASTAVDPSQPVQYAWTAVSGAEAYFLYVGTSIGASDVFYYGETQASAVTGGRLSADTTYYIRLWTKLNGIWYYQDTTFSTTAGTARLISPADGASNANSSSVQLSWNSVPTALSYFLYLGTTPGASDLYSSGQIQATSLTLRLPPNSLVYARMWTQFSGQWVYSDTRFTTSSDTYLTQPANGSTQDPSLPVQFSWTPVGGALCYYLYVGSAAGANDIVNSGQVSYTTTSITLQPLKQYYVRIWAQAASGVWYYTDSTFHTNSGIARLITPANGATGVDPFAPVTWSPAVNAQSYEILIGTQPYSQDLYSAEMLSPQVTSRIPWGLEPNTLYYATMCTEQQNVWQCSVTSFTTSGPDAAPDRSTFYSTVQSLTAQVRQMTQPPGPMENTPLPKTALYQELLDYAKDPTQPNQANCGDYAATLVTLFSQNRITSRLRGLTLNGNGYESHVITEYWDPFNDKWSVADPTFGLVYFNARTQIGQGAEEIQSYFLSAQYSSIQLLWVTQYGNWYAENYYMDPITLYNNVIPMGDPITYAPNPAYPYLTLQDLGTVMGQPGTYIVQFANPSDSVTLQESSANPNVTNVQTPLTTDGWGHAVGLYSGWSIAGSTPTGMNIYTFKRVLF